MILRVYTGIVVAAALVAAAWIFSLPDMAECRASGGEVEPTARYCESASAYRLLEEHAWFHTVPVVVLGVPVLLVGGYFIRRYERRRSPGRPR